MSSRPTVVFYPPFPTHELLNDQMARAAWYFSSFDPQKITFFASSPVEPFYLPDSFSPKVQSLYLELKERNIIDVQNDCSNNHVVSLLEAADMVITWCDEPLADAPAAIVDIINSNTIRHFDIDKNYRLEGSKYILPSYSRFPVSRSKVVKECEERYRALARNYEDNTKAYLFCSGPSISQYKDFDYKDGLSIICNSVINDVELLEWVQPKVLVFADPIFHFGCSKYTYEFYEQLRRVVDKYDLTIMMPLMYYNLFVYHMPELESRTIGIPFVGGAPINLDLSSDFNLRSAANIFTFLMLPIASSLAKDIYILGSDGRPLEENNYFWQHNEKVQFVGQMDDIQIAHPAFFKIDYNEYYIEHCQTVEKYFESGEALGKRFFSLTPSYIPALKSRMAINKPGAG